MAMFLPDSDVEAISRMAEGLNDHLDDANVFCEGKRLMDLFNSKHLRLETAP